MNDKTVLSFGALLHDVGKVVYRGISEQGTHSKLGAKFVAEEVAAINEAFDSEDGRRVVEQIRYHHASEIKSSHGLQNDSLAFITYFADNVSAGMDRRNEGDSDQAKYFDKGVKLRKIFNILHGHADGNVVEHEDYNAIRKRIKDGLAGIRITPEETNSLLQLLEAATSAVPSSTDISQLVDVSLYDHSKTTAGIALCIYDWMLERGISDYRGALFDQQTANDYYDKPMFLLCSYDISGIQSFIYNISGDGALKQLRARSLYLEILLEHIADEVLTRLELNRSNLLYTGGGHAYLLLPNTTKAKTTLAECSEKMEKWFLDSYKTDLYVASAYEECSANDLMNKGADKGRYPMLYRKLSEKLSAAKASRYDAGTLRNLNFAEDSSIDLGRECKECHRSDKKLSDDKCPLCNALEKVSANLVRKDVFVVRSVECEDLPSEHRSLSLPFGCCLCPYTHDEYLAKKPESVRLYTKNECYMGIKLATHIFMGDYTADTNHEGISAYAKVGETLKSNEGIERLGVLRADVDNLGTAFVAGISPEKISISRTATLSRALSYFFKCKLNKILEDGCYQAQIIYSGGDDLFIVGNWNDIIYAATAIRNAFIEFTGNGVLTMSAGIGMFDAKYPIARMAEETGVLEDAAKMYSSNDGTGRTKNAVALWSEQTVFAWEEFVDVVMPRMHEMQQVFDGNEKGKAFIYKLVALLRASDDAISAPRLAYLLARSFEDDKEHGEETCMKFYRWAMDEKEREYLIAALEWYVYSIRERG